MVNDFGDVLRCASTLLALAMLGMVLWRRRLLFTTGPRHAMFGYAIILTAVTVIIGSILKVLADADWDAATGITLVTVGAFVAALSVTEPTDPPRTTLREDLRRLRRH